MLVTIMLHQCYDVYNLYAIYYTPISPSLPPGQKALGDQHGPLRVILGALGPSQWRVPGPTHPLWGGGGGMMGWG